MNNIITVRVYFEHGEKIKGLTFRQRLFHGGFAHYMLKAAKKDGIKQAICFPVTSGYLSHQTRIHVENTESISFRHPQCIELTDEEDKIKSFIDAYKAHFTDTDVFIVKNEIVLKFQKTDRKEKL